MRANQYAGERCQSRVAGTYLSLGGSLLLSSCSKRQPVAAKLLKSGLPFAPNRSTKRRHHSRISIVAVERPILIESSATASSSTFAFSGGAAAACVARAMRAEARIKLFETAASRSEAAEERSPVRSEPVNGTGRSVELQFRQDLHRRRRAPDLDRVVGDRFLIDCAWTRLTQGDAVFSQTHPLAWLDLDAISFGNSRPFARSAPTCGAIRHSGGVDSNRRLAATIVHFVAAKRQDLSVVVRSRLFFPRGAHRSWTTTV
jgi:hypothetical protein